MAGGIGHDAILAGPDIEPVMSARGLSALIAGLNEFVFKISAVSLIAAAVVLTGGVIFSHATKQGVAWQDEVTIS